MKDFLGKEVTVGDYIFYSTTGRYPKSRISKVTRFTTKSMFVEVIKDNSPSDYELGKEVVVRNTFVKVQI